MNDQPKEKVILYDINTYTFPNWTSEISKNENIYVEYQKSQNTNVINRFGSWMKGKFRMGSDENALKFIFTSSKPWNSWKLSVSDSGSFALLRENMIEFYESLENKITWRAEIDCKFVRISNLFFNKHGDNLVFTNDRGDIYFYDLNTGLEMFKYIEEDANDFENSICKLFFIDPEKLNLQNIGDDVLQLIMALTYSGYFKVFTIKHNRKIDFIHQQSLLNIVPNGIYCAEIDSRFEYLVIGSFASSSYKQNTNGLKLFRILNTEPWIKHVKITNETNLTANKFNDKNFVKANFTKIEYVSKIEISPDNTCLAAIYVSGKIDIYSIPTLKLLKEWFMTEQPDYNEMNSAIVESPFEWKKFKQIYHEADFRVVDIGWWNVNVLILTRGTGLLSLVSAESLNNLMGRNQQWLNPFPSIYRYSENEFIILDCQCSLSSQSSSFDPEANDDENSELNLNESNEFSNHTDDDDDDDDEDGWVSYLTNGMKNKACNLIGIQRFKNPSKKTKFLRRKFSILHIKSTTPEELFERKLKFEEYGEALKLAETYNLDTDLVYKQQWNTKPISKSTINDYLSKIKKRSWILHECEERVSENIDWTKYLLDFGLSGTDLDALIAINEADNNRLVRSHNEDLDDDDDGPFDKFNPTQVQKRRTKLEEARLRKLNKINPKSLNLMQKELCSIRYKLLTYIDRLNVYEHILGGSIKAAQMFEPEHYLKFRSKPIHEIAFDYARQGDANAVEILFCYYSKQLKKYQLEILSNFPETLDPDDYAKLLPKIENSKVQLFEDSDEIRSEKDWIELPEFSHLIPHDYEDSTKDFSVDDIQNWYHKRVLEIESLSGLVDVSLTFAQLAYANGCKNMNDLIENLRTLFTLTYECKAGFNDNSLQISFTLSSITKLNEIDKLELIMKHSNEASTEIFTKNLQEWLLPFVLRRPTLQACESLMRDYLLKVSKDDLNPCLRLLNLKLKSKTQTQLSISSFNFNEINLISIILDCLYVNEKPEQLDLCHQLINEINSANKIDTQNQQKERLILTHHQQQQLKKVQDHLKACDIFKKYGLNKTLSYVKQSAMDQESCHDALVKLTWFASKRSNHLKINEWIELMKDLSYLQSNLYSNLIDYKDCTEIFLTSLLGSRNLENIKLAADWLKDIYNVDKEAAVRLAIKSAQEYFNASSNYFDPDMDFSKACLNLVHSLIFDSKALNLNTTQFYNNKEHLKTIMETEVDPILVSCLKMISYEYDLITSMKLIAEFNYSILPVQVRVNENRFEILKDILKKNENAFKSYDRLLELAGNMHIKTSFKSNEKPEVMLLIAEHAIGKKNYSIVNQMCGHLIRLNYEPAWLCVFKLALSICKTLCESHGIEILTREDDQIDEIYSNEKEKYLFSSIAAHNFNFKTSFGLSKEKTIASLLEIERLLAFVVTSCDVEHIQTVLLQKLSVEATRNRLEVEDENDDLVQKADRFNFDNLNSRFFNPQESEIDVKAMRKRYSKIKRIFKKMNYYKTLLNQDKPVLNNLMGLINNLNDTEFKLALSYLMDLNDTELALLFENQNCLEFNSDKSYEFLIHLLALNLNGELLEPNFKSIIYDLSKGVLADNLGSYDSSNFKTSENSFKLFKRINKQFTEFDHHNQLEHLNAGIDLDRFERDETYKEETILGLSMDLSRFKLACSLAKFYSVDLWKVYMSFTEYLLCDSSDLEQIESNLRPLTGVLTQRMDEYKKSMNERVYDFIDGKDLDKLILFYSLLTDQESDVHVKILKKLKTIDLNGFDYKEMLKRPFEVIEPFLDDSNLQLFTKIIQKVSNTNPSQLHVVWCLKKFWAKIDNLIEQNDENVWSNVENVNVLYDNFESLNESIKKLDFENDFLFFVKELTLSEKSSIKMNVQIRKELLKRINKLIKSQKLDQNQNFEKVNKELTRINNTLKLIDNVDKYLHTNFKDKDLNHKFIQMLDTQLGRIFFDQKDEDLKMEAYENVLCQMFFEGYTIEILNNLIKQFDISERTTVKKLIQLSLNRLCKDLKDKKDNKTCLDKLNLLLETISSYLTTSNESTKSKSKKVTHTTEGKIISDEDVMDCMRSFCNDQQIDIKIRLFILEELKKIVKTMKDEDLMLLLVYKTNAIFSNCDFFGKKVDLVDSSEIEDEEKRKNLIMNLIDLSETKEHFVALLSLIKIWPKFGDENPLNLILSKIIRNEIDFIQFINDLNEDKTLLLSEKDFGFIRKNVLESDTQNEKLKILLLKMGLLLRSASLMDSIKKFINTMDLECLSILERTKGNFESIESNDSFNNLVNDAELMNLIMKDNFYLEILNTNFYSMFSYYLTRNESRDKINDIVKFLKKHGHAMEAAKLLCEAECFSNSYKTFSVSLALIEKLNN